MRRGFLCLFTFWALLASADQPARTFNVAKRNNNGNSGVSLSTTSSPSPPGFVTIKGTEFMLNGSKFDFIGTNAYWLSALNNDEDIDNTLGNMSAAGVKVVRTWAFNDVETIPENGTWFQLISNGITTINNGTNGLQRLDKVMELAEKHGLFIILTLTNNWNPHINDNASATPPSEPPPSPFRRETNDTTRSRNILSNDYGGMDVYVRNFGGPIEHDSFYTNDTLITAFKNYATHIISRYKNNSRLFSWEIANDARCSSTLPSGPGCVTQNVTMWHATIAQHIQSMDPHHIRSAGHQGFMCVDCQKIFATPTPTPAIALSRPSSSPSAGAKKRGAPPKLFTKRQFLQERKKKLSKISRYVASKLENRRSAGIRVRGRWMSTPTRSQRELDDVGSTMDGSKGVDGEDINSIPEIGFNTFQLFPDQQSYGTPDPNLPAFNNTVQIGLDWIKLQAQLGRTLNKPVVMTSFGLLTKNNSQAFVPFNSSMPPFATVTQARSENPVTFGVTDQQRDDAYKQWLNGGRSNCLSGMLQYQWAQENLTAAPGGIIQSVISENMSPNDGYTIAGTDMKNIRNIISQIAQGIASDAATGA